MGKIEILVKRGGKKTATPKFAALDGRRGPAAWIAKRFWDAVRDVFDDGLVLEDGTVVKFVGFTLDDVIAEKDGEAALKVEPEGIPYGGDDCAGFEEPVGAWVDEWNGCVDADGKFHRGMFGGYRDPY